MRRCLLQAQACTKCGVSELSREIRALARDVATLRAEFEQYRAELRHVLDQFLDECSCGRPGPVLTPYPEMDGQPEPVRRFCCAAAAARTHR